MEYFFETEHLTVGYNGKPVVKNIEARIQKGQILSLIGPNGSGKSTILRSIAKQLKTIGGIVRIGSNSLEDIGFRELSRQTALVLTERPKPERMTCGDVVAVGRYPYTGMLGILSATDRKKIDEALRMVGATQLKNRNFAQVSDGQLQRVMLARAICQEPEIIVLDEPTSFLDILYAVDILDILRQMADERGVTVVMSLHELIYAKRVSDLVMCVKDGHVLRLDTPEVIFTKEIISRLYDLPDGIYEQLFGGFEFENH
jgi:iron complex transport system ATP-binding protein